MGNRNCDLPIVTVVIPAYNEEENLPALEKRLLKVLNQIENYIFEVLLIDNCSEDNSGTLMEEMATTNPRWQYIRFSRNFGFETSLAAGVHYARGDALIFLSSDLQEPPEEIPRMLELWQKENYDVVYGVVNTRNDYSIIKTFGAKIAYWMINKLSEVQIPKNATDFRLISRPVIDALKQCRERNRYMRGLVHWMGFKSIGFEYDRAERTKGRTSANIIYSFKFAVQAMVAFSQTPLHFASIFGFICTLFSVFGLLFYGITHLSSLLGFAIFRTPPPGWSTIAMLILFFGGVQCMFLGVIGEYIGRNYTESKARPRWVIHRKLGFDHLNDGSSENEKQGVYKPRSQFNESGHAFN